MKLKEYLSTLNLIMLVSGYAFVTSLFVPIVSNVEVVTTLVTVPYRALILLLSLVVLFLHLTGHRQITYFTKLYIVFWILLLFRMFYDLEIRDDFFVSDSLRNKLWLYSIGVCIISMISVLLSIRSINFKMCFWGIYLTTTISMILSLKANEALFMNDIGRLEGNVALSSISFGHSGVLGALLSLFCYKNTRSFIVKVLCLGIFVLGIFIMLKAGSRGPLVAFVIVILSYGISRSKNFVTLIWTVGLSVLLIYFLQDYILDWIEQVSPVMRKRLELAINEYDSSGRDIILVDAINEFLDNPILGSQFAFNLNGGIRYSHNIIVDAFMGLGLFGGILFVVICFSAVKRAIQIFNKKIENEWVAIIFLQSFLGLMLSGALYYSETFKSIIIILFSSKYMQGRKNVQNGITV